MTNATDKRLILLEEREPHMRWGEFGECVCEAVSKFSVSTIYFLGSFGGVAPHGATHLSPRPCQFTVCRYGSIGV